MWCQPALRGCVTSSLPFPSLPISSPLLTVQTAEYFCTGTLEDRGEWRHYALNVPFYTHFTSPIRRYADIIVHRLLAECLGKCASQVTCM